MKVVKHASYGRHLGAYAWAAQHCYKKPVVDIGCGEGYGLELISLFATSVGGVDVSPTYIKKAENRNYKCEKFLLQADLDDENLVIGMRGGVVLAFEILEHVKNPEALVKRIAATGTTLIFSVPHNYPHELHLTNFTSQDEVRALVQPYLLAGEVEFLWMNQEGLISRVPFEGEELYRYLAVCSFPKWG